MPFAVTLVPPPETSAQARNEPIPSSAPPAIARIAPTGALPVLAVSPITPPFTGGRRSGTSFHTRPTPRQPLQQAGGVDDYE